MAVGGAKEILHGYLSEARAAMLWKLDGLSDYDVRRPLTGHGTNLLGLVKHLSGCEIGYFGAVFGRPFSASPPWLTGSDDPCVDMWATAEESRGQIVALYQGACRHADETIAALDLDHSGTVPTWPQERRAVTLHQILVHMIAETSRHAGHADIVRELIDNRAGVRADRSGIPEVDANYWPALCGRIEDAARQADDLIARPVVHLRPMTATEYAVVTTIREDEALRELAKQIPESLARERVRRRAAELLPDGLDTVGHRLVVGVDAEGAVVGYAWVGPDSRSTVSASDSAWLHELHVHPAFRRRGYGLGILTALEDLLNNDGVRRVALKVAGNNLAAVALYRRLGYVATSQFMARDISAPR